jgi:Zn-dependent protease
VRPLEPYDLRDYEPIHPRGRDWRRPIKRLFGPVVAVVIAAVKFGGVFVWLWAYAASNQLGYGIGIILLILVHELGHFLEAKREGLNPRLPVFIPFLGAYVQYRQGNVWQTARVAIAGPIVGGLASVVCLVVGEVSASNLMLKLALIGLALNLVNLAPINFFGLFALDGYAIWKSLPDLRKGGGRRQARIIVNIYALTVLVLAAGTAFVWLTRFR